MAQGISLIVGLGNPGAEYAETLNNAGFRFLDVLLDAIGEKLRHESRFSANVGKLTVSGKDVWLLEPQTFMNHSGDAVSRFAHYYKIPATEILVVHGTVRSRNWSGVMRPLACADWARTWVHTRCT